MTARIMRKSETLKLGGVTSASITGRKRDKRYPITTLAVYGEKSPVIEVVATGKDVPVINLTPAAGIELVKGLLLNLPGLDIRGDHELQQILKMAVEKT